MTVINASTAFRHDHDAYERAMARGLKAAQAVRESGGTAMEVAIAQIRATFDEQLRADTLAALKLSAAIASGRKGAMKMDRTWEEWKEFLDLPNSTVEEDEEYADELNYLGKWEWGEGVDARSARIGAAILLGEIKKTIAFWADVPSEDSAYAVDTYIKLFDEMLLKIDIESELKEVGFKIVRNGAAS
jgi:hypothetical protein